MNVWLASGTVGGVVALVALVIRVLVGRKKLDADTAAVFTATATELIEPLRKELREARRELSDTRDEMAALRRHLRLMEDLLRQHNIPTPAFVWPPGNGRTR